MTNDWNKVQTRQQESYRWMDGNWHIYPEFTVYENTKTGDRFGVGRSEPEEHFGRPRTVCAVFSMEDDKISQPVAIFNEPDDFDTSHEMLALIRGKGPDKRAFYERSDLPGVYLDLDFKFDTFRDRVTQPGARNRVSVVANVEDHETMLKFGAIQQIGRFT